MLTAGLQSAIPEVIHDLDEYFLSKEEWDTIVELGLDECNETVVMKKISAATKTALTKKCVLVLVFSREVITMVAGTTAQIIRLRITKTTWARSRRRSLLMALRLILKMSLM